MKLIETMMANSAKALFVATIALSTWHFGADLGGVSGAMAQTETEAETETGSDAEMAVDPIEIFTGDRVLGNPDAPVTIVEYASFTCPHCRDFHTNVYPTIKENYIDTGKAKLVYREVFFDGPGLLAGSLARCVPEDKYHAMIATLYQNDQEWVSKAATIEDVVLGLSKLGTLAGLNSEQISSCLDNRDAQNAMIENSRTHMDEDKVTGTPTLIVNGEKVENWAIENLSAAIDAEVPEDFVPMMADEMAADATEPTSN